MNAVATERLCITPLTVIRILFYFLFYDANISYFPCFSSSRSKLRQRRPHCPILLPRINSLRAEIRPDRDADERDST